MEFHRVPSFGATKEKKVKRTVSALVLKEGGEITTGRVPKDQTYVLEYGGRKDRDNRVVVHNDIPEEEISKVLEIKCCITHKKVSLSSSSFAMFNDGRGKDFGRISNKVFNMRRFRDEYQPVKAKLVRIKHRSDNYTATRGNSSTDYLEMARPI